MYRATCKGSDVNCSSVRPLGMRHTSAPQGAPAQPSKCGGGFGAAGWHGFGAAGAHGDFPPCIPVRQG